MGRSKEQNASRVRGWLDDEESPNWQRPRPNAPAQRLDVVLAVALAAANLVAIVLMQSYGGLLDHDRLTVPDYVGAVLMPLCLALRRRYPLATLVAATVAFVAMYFVAPAVSVSVVFQVSYFAAIYTSVAWSRHRGRLWSLITVILVGIAGWVVITWIATQSIQTSLDQTDTSPNGPLDPVVAFAVFSTAVNLAYVSGAAAFGRGAWRAALRRHQLERQAVTIREQADQLTRNAVAQERLRLARDLHDSIGHHFTGVGLQAGGARRVLDRGDDGSRIRLEPAQAALVRKSLTSIERSTREGIGELQTVLGVLRDPDEAEGTSGVGFGNRKSILDLPQLVSGFEPMGLKAVLLVSDDAAAVLRDHGDRLPAVLHHGVYRMVQESLTNVLKHSDATDAQVFVRVSPSRSELDVEVVDHGMPVGSPDRGVVPSSGAGLLGLTERAGVLGGHVVSGPCSPPPGWSTRFTVPVHAYLPETLEESDE